MNTFELLEDLRSASRDNLHSIVLTIVFEDDPVLAGKLMNILDLTHPDDVRIHKEFIICILLLMSTIVDAHIKCKNLKYPVHHLWPSVSKLIWNHSIEKQRSKYLMKNKRYLKRSQNFQ